MGRSHPDDDESQSIVPTVLEQMHSLLHAHETSIRLHIDQWGARQEKAISNVVTHQRQMEERIRYAPVRQSVSAESNPLGAPPKDRSSWFSLKGWMPPVPTMAAQDNDYYSSRSASTTFGRLSKVSRSPSSPNADTRRWGKMLPVTQTLSSLFERKVRKSAAPGSRHHHHNGFATARKSLSRRYSVSGRNSAVPYSLRSACRCFVDFLQRVVRHSAFDIFCCLLILANSVLVGFETEYLANHNNEPNDVYFNCQLALNIWFITELSLRIMADGAFFFVSEEWKWNWFDCLLVLTSILDVFFASLNWGGLKIGRIFRTIRLLRILRTLRIVRILRFIAVFRKMVFSVASSLQTLFWSLLLLCFIMYCFGIWLTQGVADYLADDAYHEFGESLETNFGSLSKAMKSLFLAITNGISWGLLLDPLLESDVTLAVLFLCYVSLCLLGVLNVVTSVFVESAMQSTMYYKDLLVAEKQKSKEQYVLHVKEIFNQIDVDDSGCINADELRKYLSDEHLQLSSYFEALELNPSDTQALFKLLDPLNEGEINIDEFVDGCLKLKGDAKSFDVHCIWYESNRQHQKVLRCLEDLRKQMDDMKRMRHGSVATLSHATIGLPRSLSRLANQSRQGWSTSPTLGSFYEEPMFEAVSSIGCSHVLPSAPNRSFTQGSVSIAAHGSRPVLSTMRSQALSTGTPAHTLSDSINSSFEEQSSLGIGSEY